MGWMIGTGQAATHRVHVHPSGSPIFMTNIGSDTVTMLERGANPLAWNVTQIAVGKGPEALDVTPDGKLLLIPDLYAGELVVVGARTRTEVERLRLGRSPEGMLIVPDGMTRVP